MARIYLYYTNRSSPEVNCAVYVNAIAVTKVKYAYDGYIKYLLLEVLTKFNYFNHFPLSNIVIC